eukprot:1556619-Rhodomonas_salina.5
MSHTRFRHTKTSVSAPSRCSAVARTNHPGCVIELLYLTLRPRQPQTSCSDLDLGHSQVDEVDDRLCRQLSASQIERRDIGQQQQLRSCCRLH